MMYVLGVIQGLKCSSMRAQTSPPRLVWGAWTSLAELKTIKTGGVLIDMFSYQVCDSHVND